MLLKRLLEACLLPPLSCLLLVTAGLLLRRHRRRAGNALVAAGLLLLVLLSMPVVAGALLGALQESPPLPAEGPLPRADAIVVLSAEADFFGAEFGAATVGRYTLQRIRYAAWLHQKSRLPVLTSGGRPGTGLPSLAELMKATLEGELSTPVRWIEEDSADTWENAVYSAGLLRDGGARRILLVTHAWHMPRARRCFEAQGLEVVPAPTAFRGPAFRDLTSLIPTTGGLRDSTLALHEWLGRLWYALRGR